MYMNKTVEACVSLEPEPVIFFLGKPQKSFCGSKAGQKSLRLSTVALLCYVTICQLGRERERDRGSNVAFLVAKKTFI